MSFIYSPNLFVFICVFVFIYLLVALLVMTAKILFSANKRFHTINILNITFPIVFIFYMVILTAPIPNKLQNNLKLSLAQLKENNVESNGMINWIIYSCDKNNGFVRGVDYKTIMEQFSGDIDDHIRKNTSFTISLPDHALAITQEPICEYAIDYNRNKNKT